VFITYILIFSFSLLLSLVLTWYVRALARVHGWLDPPRLGRHVHTVAVPRLGGIAIYASFMVVAVVVLLAPARLRLSFVPPIKLTIALLGSALVIFLLGLLDDLYGVGPYGKLLVQVVAATFLFTGGFGIHRLDLISSGQILHSFIGLPLTILWVLLITNAFNLIDGLDGLAAGSALLSMAVMFVVAMLRNDATASIMILVLAGATCGFLPFNFHPATIFLGDSGSLFIGFLLSALALVESEKATTAIAVAIPMVSFGLPVVDVALAVLRRLIRGKHLFCGDNDHIHHRLLKKGFSHRDAVILLYAISAGFGLLSLSLLHGQNRIALVLSVVGVGVWYGVRYLRYAELLEVQGTLALLLQRRRILANNLAIRQAAEALDSSSDFNGLCKVVRTTLEPLGFVGVCFQLYAKNGASNELFAPLRDDGNGELWCYWNAEIAPAPEWELRLELVPRAKRCIGKVSLFRSSCNEPICIDSHLLCSAFRMALTGAVDRALANVSVRAGENELVEVARAH
jgi:UDP-GlcNAc:undecaprenyl-phosphate GlcNAc-1-phosphate transferase